jgi:hypothetical protein
VQTHRFGCAFRKSLAKSSFAARIAVVPFMGSFAQMSAAVCWSSSGCADVCGRFRGPEPEPKTTFPGAATFSVITISIGQALEAEKTCFNHKLYNPC